MYQLHQVERTGKNELCVFRVLLFIFAIPNSKGQGEAGFTRLYTLFTTGQLQAGDILISNINNNYHLVGEGVVFKMPSEVCPFAYDVKFCSFKLPLEDRWDRAFLVKKVGIAPDVQKSIALARRLVRTYLPYHAWHCTKNDYWRYILYGRQPRVNMIVMRSCPLAAPLDKVSAEQISSGKFQFMNFHGRSFSGFPPLGAPANGKVRFCLLGKMLGLTGKDHLLGMPN